MSRWGGISSKEMAAVDENAEWLGVPRALLMENAGAWVARTTYQWLGGVANKRIAVFCGTGNNGGDGFAAARHLAGLGAKVIVVLIGDPSRIRTQEARMNFDIVKRMKESIKLLIVSSLEGVEEIRSEMEGVEVVVDATFGTGIKGEIREPWRSVIQLINSLKALRIAVDIPSGVNPDTGEIGDISVNADVTVTFHKPKLGMPAAADYCGEVVIVPIGIPPEAELLMGPGNARQALRSMGDEAEEVILFEDLPEEAKALMRILGVSYKLGKDVRERVVYVGRRVDLVEGRDDFSAAVALGIASNPKLISIIDEEKAGEKLGISLENGLHEKYRSLSKKSSELEQLIYIRGMKTDLLIGDSRWRLSWIDRPLNDAGVNTLIAVTLSLIARSVDRFEAAAAAGYLAGVATKSGYRAALNELNRLMGRS